MASNKRHQTSHLDAAPHFEGLRSFLCLGLEEKGLTCDQIRVLLDAYGVNELPGFKVTWVAQHLGGCQACRTLFAAPPVESKPAPTAEWLGYEPPVVSTGSAGWIPVTGFVLMLCVALPILLLQLLNQAEAGTARPQRIRFQTSVQAQSGVTASVTQLVHYKKLVTGILRFEGQGLALPQHLEAGFTVDDYEGKAYEITVNEVVSGPDSLTVHFQVDLPPHSDRFTIFVGAVWVELRDPWTVELPPPANGLGGGGFRLQGSPPGIKLIAYGLVGDMLMVHVRAPLPPGRLVGSQFYLIDAVGTQTAPSTLQETSGPEDHALWIQYPVPRETRLPYRIAGQRISQKVIGPWQFPVLLVP